MFYDGQVTATNLPVTEELKIPPTISGVTIKYPVFKKWKGEEANKALEVAWRVSGGDKDFILTMTAENGAWDLKRKHPKNRNGTIDYSMGLNSAYHTPMIKDILAGKKTPDEIMRYHYDIYKKRKGAFYGYYKRNTARVKNQIIFPN